MHARKISLSDRFKAAAGKSSTPTFKSSRCKGTWGSPRQEIQALKKSNGTGHLRGGAAEKAPDHLMSVLYFGVTHNDTVSQEKDNFLRSQIEEIYEGLKRTYLQNITLKMYLESLQAPDLRAYLTNLSTLSDPTERYYASQMLYRFHSYEKYGFAAWNW